MVMYVNIILIFPMQLPYFFEYKLPLISSRPQLEAARKREIKKISYPCFEAAKGAVFMHSIICISKAHFV